MKRRRNHVTWKQLLRIPGLYARAEYSGCEGCYVEIAKWNRHTNSYQKFAFLKFFSGEVWRDLHEDLIAARIAAMINLLSKSSVPVTTTKKLRSYRYEGKTYKCQKPMSICDVRPFEYACIVRNMPNWNPVKQAA